MGAVTVPANSNAVTFAYTVTGLTSGSTYYFKVTAVNGAGESPQSNEASATVHGTPLAAPIGITAVDGAGAIDVSWSSVTGATGYNLYRSVGGATVLYQPGLSSPSYNDPNVAAGITYGYSVCAVNSVGQGPASTTATATYGSGTLPAPTGLVATASSGSTQIGLGWNAVFGATSYKVYRGTSSGGEGATSIGTVYPTTPPGPFLAYTDSGPTSGTTYYYEVTALSSAGESGKSNEASATAGTAGLSAPKGFRRSRGPLRSR